MSIDDKFEEVSKGKRTFLKRLFGVGSMMLVLGTNILNFVYTEEALSKPYEWKKIDELYDMAIPAEYIMPGARIIEKNKSNVRDNALGFSDDEWTYYYFSDTKASKFLQKTFKDLNKQKIYVNTPNIKNKEIIFDFDKFHKYCESKKGKFKLVAMYYKGFMTFTTTDDNYKLIIPIDPLIIDPIKNAG